MEQLFSRDLRPLAAGLAATIIALLPLTAFADPHTVRPGETLSEIAERYGVPVRDLAALNGISNPDHIVIGQQLAIASSRPGGFAAQQEYRIQPGDSLSGIAARFGVSVADLVALNGLADPDHIVAGRTLAIPAASAPVRATSGPARNVEQELRAAAAEFGVDTSLVLAVAWQESGWQQTVISHAGAVGVMQVLPATAEWALEYLVPDAEAWEYDIRDNVRLGVAILGALIDQAGGDLELGLAFYHQGWHSVERFGFFDETNDYIANVKVIRERYR